MIQKKNSYVIYPYHCDARIMKCSMDINNMTEYKQLKLVRILRNFKNGKTTITYAADQILKVLNDSDFIPVIHKIMSTVTTKKVSHGRNMLEHVDSAYGCHKITSVVQDYFRKNVVYEIRRNNDYGNGLSFKDKIVCLESSVTQSSNKKICKQLWAITWFEKRDHTIVSGYDYEFDDISEDLEYDEEVHDVGGEDSDEGEDSDDEEVHDVGGEDSDDEWDKDLLNFDVNGYK